MSFFHEFSFKKCVDNSTYRQTDRQTDRHTDRQINNFLKFLLYKGRKSDFYFHCIYCISVCVYYGKILFWGKRIYYIKKIIYRIYYSAVVLAAVACTT